MHTPRQHVRELVALAQHGNRDAFGQLFAEFRDRLLRAVVIACGSRDEAEDIVQHTFLQAYTHLPQFRGDCAFFSWLYRIAFNTVVQRSRGRRRRTQSLDQRHAQGLDPMSRYEAPQQPLEREENAALVRAALDSLTPDLRTSLVLRELEGCEYQQIAEILETPIGTIRSRIHRARAKLREYLEEAIAAG